MDKAITENHQLFITLTELSKEKVIQLLDICLNASVFLQNGIVYQSKDGIPMESPISVASAELTMQHIESKIWKRYLDQSNLKFGNGIWIT